MKKFYSLLFAVAAIVSVPSKYAAGQCGFGYTQAQLNWDNLDYITSTGNYSGWVSAARAATQRFAIGTNGVTIAYTGSITNNGETSNHTADVGDDIDYSAVANSGETATITLTFDNPVTNPLFSIYDIDRRQIVAVNGKDAAALDLITTIVRRTGTSILTLTPILGIGTNPSATASNTSVGNGSHDGTIDISMVGLVKTITLSISNTGGVSSPDLFISDINACVTGAYVNNWRNISRPFTGMPSYILTVRNNVFYQLNPANGRADSLFTDATHTNMNAMSYDPVNRYVYYGYSLTGGSSSTTRTIYRYSLDNNTRTNFITDINVGVAEIPSYEPGVTSGSASFYNGAMYLGIESSNSSRTTGRENTVWRIDLDALQNPTRATQIYATRSDSNIAGNDVLIHDWSDIGISNNGMLYDFDGSAGDSMYYHYNMMTGQRVQFAPNGAGNIGPKQLGIDWQENVYNMGGLPSGTPLNIGGYVVPYNYNGTVNNAQNQLVYTMPGTIYPTGSWGDCGEAYRPYCDFGDAPATYDPDPWSPAVHERDTAIRIGATWDREWIKTSSIAANADGADEDGLAFVPILSPTAGNYLAQVSIYNNTGGDATLIAWLDYNNNGVFNAGEACQTQPVVASMPSLQSRFLYWPSISSAVPNGTYTYLRIRLVRTAAGMTNANPTGYYDHGETEDYRVLADNYPLTANLLSFNAKLITAANVELKWNSSEEENFRGYEIQRSADNINWNSLDFSDAKGNGVATEVAYSYNDLRPLTGKSFYRLKLVSNDGKFKYSEVRTVTIQKGVQEITVLPNPATDKVSLLINTSYDATASFTVTDVSGRILHRQTAVLRKGTNNTNLPVTDKLSSGMYFIQAEINGEIFVRKLIIKKM
jgi:GEVED domain/Secretion system C-terminal sorting domain